MSFNQMTEGKSVPDSIALKDFIAESLKQIIDGVSTAQGYAAEKGAIVDPPASSSTAQHYDSETGRVGQAISFDIAVTATKGSSTEGGIGVVLGAIGMGSRGKSEAEDERLHRISFTIPLIFPLQAGSK